MGLEAAQEGQANQLIEEAIAAHRKGDELTAIANLTVALTQGESRTARLLRAHILAGMGQWNEAAADAEAVLAHEPDTPDAALLLAATRSAQGQNLQATDTLLSLLKAHPDCRPAILMLGRLYLEEGRADLALALYDRAIADMPTFAEAYHARGGVKHRLHDEAGAAEDLRRALQLNPSLAQDFDGTYSLLDSNGTHTHANCLRGR